MPHLFHQDGAPPQHSFYVQKALDTRFGGRWIGREEPTPWPPRSPDLTSLELLGQAKNEFYSKKVRDLNYPRRRTTIANVSFSHKCILPPGKTFIFGLYRCRATIGTAYTEFQKKTNLDSISFN